MNLMNDKNKKITLELGKVWYYDLKKKTIILILLIIKGRGKK